MSKTKVTKQNVMIFSLHQNCSHWFIQFISMKTFNSLTTARANILARTFLAINCQPLELESCSNPLWILQVFQLTSKKKRFSFWLWGFLGGSSQVGEFLCYFGHLCLALVTVPMGHVLDSKFSWKLGQNLHL